MNWENYRLTIEDVPIEDGGGVRIYYPTLGFAVYGDGETVDEALDSLESSQRAMEQFMAETPGYTFPCPREYDQQVSRGDAANNNYAYAA